MAEDLQTTISILAETGQATSSLGRLDQAFRKFFEDAGKTPDEAKAFLKLAKDVEQGKVAIEGLDKETRALVETFQKLREVARARDTLELIPHARIKDEIAKVRTAYETLRTSGKLTADELAQASRRTEQQIGALNARLKETGDNLNVTGEKAGFFATALKRLAGVFAVREIVKLSDSIEQLKETLKVIAGSTEAATDEFKFIRAESDRMGLAFGSAAKAYVQLATAAKGTALEGQKTRDIFSAVAGAMARIGKSDEVEAALFAITKVMADGTITSREFFGQLSKFLPNALQITAKELGLTTDVLQVMIDRGEIAVNDFLPNFARALDKAFGNETKEKIDGIGSSINRALNSLNKVGETVANLEILHIAFNGLATIGGLFASVLNGASITLVAFTEFVVAAGIAVGEFFKALSSGDFAGFADRVKAAFTVARDEINKTTERIVATDENLQKLRALEKGAAVEAKEAADKKTAAIEKTAAAEKQAAKEGAAAFASLSAGLKEAVIGLERSKDSADGLKAVFSTLFSEGAFTNGEAGLAKIDAVMTRLAKTTNIMSAEVRDGLGEALAKLTNTKLREFEQVATKAFSDGRLSMEKLVALTDGALSASLKKLGVNSEIAFDGISRGASDAIENYSALAKSGKFSADTLKAAFKGVLEKLDSPKAVQSMIEAIRLLGKDGKISVQQVEDQIDLLTERLADLTPGIQSVAEAFKELGLKAATSLQEVADKARQAFDVIRGSGATVDDIRRAFLAYAQAALAAAEASGKPADGLLRAQAAALGLSGELGKLINANQKLSVSFEVVARAQDQANKAAEAHTRAVEAEGRAAIAIAQATLEQAKARGNALEITRATIALAETESAVAAKVAQAKREEAAAAAEKVAVLEREALADQRLTEAEREVLAAAEEVAQAKAREADAAQSSATAKAAEARASRQTAEAAQGLSVALESALAFQRDLTALTQEYGKQATDVYTKVAAGIEASARSANGLIEVTGSLIDSLRRDSAEASGEILQLTAALAKAGTPTEALTRSAEQALEKYRDLGDEALSGLRQALDDARQRTEALRAAAKSAADQLRDQLDQLQGNEQAVAAREFEKKKAELEAQLKEARKAGDRQAQKDLQDALGLLVAVRTERDRQRAQEKAQSGSARQGAGAGGAGAGGGDQQTQPPPPTFGRGGDLKPTFNLYGAEFSEDYFRRKVVPLLDKINRQRR